jgi:REP element-mobilizing transposase RayT
MRTPQKRFYIDEAVYFITAVTEGRRPFFRESIFADLFVVDLWFATKVKEFKLYGYTVVSNHVHLLIQPFGPTNISNVLGSLKRNVSRDIDDMIQGRPRSRKPGGDDSNRPLPGSLETTKASIEAMRSAHPDLDPETLERHFQLILDLRAKYLRESRSEFRDLTFRWQKSFYDHVIRGQQDFLQHLDYIFGNAVKHGLARAAEDWQWMWVYGTDEPKEFQ